MDRKPTATLVGFLTSRGSAAVGALGLIFAYLLPPQGGGITSCGFHLLTGSPCPGCGLTRSVCQTAHGDLVTAWSYHPFGIPIFVCFALLSLSFVLPQGLRARLRAFLAPTERALSWILWLGLIAMLLFGLGRLVAWWGFGWRPSVPL